MDFTSRKFLTWTGVAVLAAIALYYVLSSPAIPVDIAAIHQGPLEVTVADEGVTRIKEVYTVSAPVAGRVLRAPHEIGDEVKAGKTRVASIHPVDPAFLDERSRRAAVARANAAQAALKYAKATVTKVKAELTFARADLDRAQRLVKRQATSERNRDQAQLKVDTATAALENANADVEVRVQELENARAQLIEPGTANDHHTADCCIQILAPESGRVLKIMKESETVVSAGTPILEIGNPQNLEIIVDLLSSDSIRVAVGAKAYIERWGGDETLKARVERIESSGFMKISALGIEEQRVKVRLDLTTPPERWSRLGHDYRVFVRIVVWGSDKTLKVPLSALFRKGNDWAVFKVIDNEAKLQKVKIGHRNQTNGEILDGLAAGDTVILHPSDRIQDGTDIIERKELQ